MISTTYTNTRYTITFSTSERIIHTSKLQRSPISYRALQQSTVDDTHTQSVEEPHTSIFVLRMIIFLAHDEPTSWISQPFPFLSIQSPTRRFPHYNFCPQLS